MCSEIRIGALISNMPRGLAKFAEELNAWSLHASKRLRVSVSEMQAYTQRFQQLAAQFGGHYDGWTTDKTRT